MNSNALSSNRRCLSRLEIARIATSAPSGIEGGTNCFTRLLVCVPILAAGYLYWDNARRFQSTDDSFIAARQFAIAPKVPGYITAVPVTDNQQVAAGDVVALINDHDYRITLDQAEAQLAHDQSVLDRHRGILPAIKPSRGQMLSLCSRSTIRAPLSPLRGSSLWLVTAR
jgi:hypothetical protein